VPVVSSAIAEASAAMVREASEQLASTAAERRRRQVLRLIDLALEQCEERNLAAAGPGKGVAPPRDLEPPPMAVALIDWLQLQEGGSAQPPTCNQEALEELFRLQQAYLLTPEGESELEAAELEEVVS
jgi:hypothetical protein